MKKVYLTSPSGFPEGWRDFYYERFLLRRVWFLGSERESCFAVFQAVQAGLLLIFLLSCFERGIRCFVMSKKNWLSGEASTCL